MAASLKPADRLVDSFSPIMEGEGYTYHRTNHRFLKPFRHGKHEFGLMFDGRGGLVAVDAAFFVHFESLLKLLRKILGHACPWTAGATLLNSGADPWKFWLFDEKYARMSIQERSGIPSHEIHPEVKIQAGVRFLSDAYHEYAVPFFQRLRTYRELADFYREYLANGCTGRCRPNAEQVVYLSAILAAYLGDAMEPIRRCARGMQSAFAGQGVDSNVQKVWAYTQSIDVAQMLQ